MQMIIKKQLKKPRKYSEKLPGSKKWLENWSMRLQMHQDLNKPSNNFLGQLDGEL
jgi:hypothetical protein